jgi:hypothetical protein
MRAVASKNKTLQGVAGFSEVHIAMKLAANQNLALRVKYRKFLF